MQSPSVALPLLRCHQLWYFRDSTSDGVNDSSELSQAGSKWGRDLQISPLCGTTCVTLPLRVTTCHTCYCKKARSSHRDMVFIVGLPKSGCCNKASRPARKVNAILYKNISLHSHPKEPIGYTSAYCII